MSEVPVIPEVKESNPTEPKAQTPWKKSVDQKKAATKPVITNSAKKAHRTWSSAKTAKVKKSAAPKQRKPFPYTRC